MERLNQTKVTGINGNALRTWGLLFLAAGTVGRGILQNQLLGLGRVSTQQLLQVMQSSDTAMTLTTVSLVLQAMETCAAPIFALLLVEGLQHTSSFKEYLLRVLGLAALSEIPFNLALSGKLLDFGSRNAAFGLVLCMVMVYFWRRYEGAGFKNVLIKILVTAAAVVWAEMLKIDFGSAMVLIVASLWALREKTLYRNFVGATVTIVCSIISPFFLAAPMGFLAVHFYNGEKGDNSRKITYLSYPAMLLVVGLVGVFLV